MGHGCRISLFIKHKLKLGGRIQILRDRKLSKRVSLLKELWQLHHGMQKSPTLDENLVARQSKWTPTATCYKDRERLITGRDMNVCREVLNLHHSSANQHSKRLIQESLQSLHCDFPDQTPYSPELDPLIIVCSGRWSNTLDVAYSIVMRKWILLFVNSCESKNPIWKAMENSCQDRTKTSMWSTTVLKNNDTCAEYS
jgi:hypothetical protein